MSEDSTKYSKFSNKLIIIIFGLSGMTALIYEIIWIRPLSLVFGTTTYAISIIIAAFLSGLALGSWIAGRYSDKIKNPLRFYGFLEIGIGLYGLMIIGLFSILPEIYLNMYKGTFPEVSIFFVLQFALAFIIILVPTTLMGATLPMIMKSHSRNFNNIGRDLGRIYSVNNIGAVLGTIAAGFILMPLLGIQTSIMITAILNIALGIIALIASKSSNIKKILAITITIVFISSFSAYDFKLMQFGMYLYADPQLDMDFVNDFLETQEVKFHKESTYASVSVLEFDNAYVMKLNGKVQCSDDPLVLEGMNRLGFVPYELYKHNYQSEPENALNIGLGCGYTSKWLADNVSTTTIEIDPTIVEASKFFVDDIDHELIIDDARSWLTRNDVKYEIITMQPSDPYAGWYMFTSEFFSLIEKSITKDGIVALWVPVYYMSIDDFHIMYNTFHSIFPYVHVYQQEENSAQLLFIGSNKELEIIDKNLYIASEKEIPQMDTAINTDDRPVLEFSTSLHLYNNDSRLLFEKFQEWAEKVQNK